MFQRHNAPPAISSASPGVVVPYEIGKGYNLLASTTYYIDASLPDASIMSIHCTWDGNIILTSLNYESSNMPAFASQSDPYSDNSGVADVANNATDAAGLWLPWNPSTAYIPIVGGTVTSATIAVAGGAAGGCVFELTQADRRGRTKIVVGTTGGYFRQHMHGKQA